MSEDRSTCRRCNLEKGADSFEPFKSDGREYRRRVCRQCISKMRRARKRARRMTHKN